MSDKWESKSPFCMQHMVLKNNNNESLDLNEFGYYFWNF